MTKREMTQRLRDEHQKQWDYAKDAAQMSMKNHPEKSDKEIAESLNLLEQRIRGLEDAATALGLNLMRVSTLDSVTVSIWREKMEDSKI